MSNAECLEAGLGRMERAKELIYRCRVQSPCSKPVASLVRSEALLFDGGNQSRGINHGAEDKFGFVAGAEEVPEEAPNPT